MSPTWTTFLFEAANFLVLAALLGWLFFKPVRQALADRQAKFAASTAQAEQLLGEAEDARRQVDAERSGLQAELNEMRAGELEAARKRAEQIVAEARAVAERERELSRREAARISETQQVALAEAAAAAAADTVGRLLHQIQGPDLQSALIAAACRQLRGLVPEEATSVKIESAQQLSAEQVAILNDALGSAAAKAEYRIDSSLGPGVRIVTAKGLIDASISGLVQYARTSLIEEMDRRTNNHHPLRGAGDV